MPQDQPSLAANSAIKREQERNTSHSVGDLGNLGCKRLYTVFIYIEKGHLLQDYLEKKWGGVFWFSAILHRTVGSISAL